MNAGVTSERVYEALKARLLAGTVPPGERLEPKKLAALLASSVSPVRDALHRLAGEHIVEMRTAEGFQLPLVTEPALRDLIQWNGELLRIALRRWPAAASREIELPPPEDYAARLRALFGIVAARSGLTELARQVEAASDRLAVSRAAESRVAADAGGDLAEIDALIEAGDARSIARRIDLYHRQRMALVPAIVETIYRLA
ncbi:GntR family transcriptional regulator [Sphingopyxis sp. GC21]|uniref:GntR family transcriptional regulator n=1 Tax=Sphingopyxis sp. GC21 TaxID=2933562 RepID=UPI0021E48336|nr:GntR family transcriptional regulator [Sphingopyxis sp. GC21]